nr:dihydroxy-acid dehydratase [Bartonella quintana]
MYTCNGRQFSGETSGLSIRHILPEAVEGGTIALVEERYNRN